MWRSAASVVPENADNSLDTLHLDSARHLSSRVTAGMPSKSKRSLLADQLAALDNPAPVDLDPENAENYVDSDSDASEHDGGDDDDGERDDGRGHYTAVGKSRLRDTENERPVKAAYKGQKSSRKDIFEESADVSVSGDEESGSEGDMDAFEDLDRGGESEEVTGSDQSGFSGQDESESDNDEEEDDSEDERQAEELKKMLADDQKAMVQEVVKTATADAEKGKAVKKQLAIYDSLLDSRIKLQKGLQNVNLVSELQNKSLDASIVSEAEETALGLIETIFSLREDLMAQDLSTMPPSRKRKYNDGEDVALVELWNDMQAFETSLASWRDHTLTKWSNKIQAASGLDKGRKFKALNQGILAQIEESKSDREKLLRRTRIKRFKAGGANKTVSQDDISEDIYDDGDFYQEMLKDLIDSRMLDSTNGNQMKWIATKQPKQKRVNVDTRASKGRKLRYHVHEKMQNFMAPMPTGNWHEEQVDELFGSLLGQTLRVDEDMEEAGEENDKQGRREVETVEVGDDFKLFG